MTFPITPRKAIANSGKKRAPLPDLSRPSPSGSHGTRMAAIFYDAARSLDNAETPSKSCSSNTKRSRIPLSQAKRTPFGSLSYGGTQKVSQLGSPSPMSTSRQSRHSPEGPIMLNSSARAQTPIANPDGRRPSPPLSYQDLSPSRSSIRAASDPNLQLFNPPLDSWKQRQRQPNKLGYQFTDEEQRSTPSVPLTLPLYPAKAASQHSGVHSWLEEVTVSSSTGLCSTHPTELQYSPETGEVATTYTRSSARFPSSEPPTSPSKPLHTVGLSPTSSIKKSKPSISPPPSSSSSNKENRPPISPSPNSPRIPFSPPPPTTSFLSANLSHFGFFPSSAASDAIYPKPTALYLHTSIPPPKTPRSRKEATCSSKLAGRGPTFTIHEDETADAVRGVVGLSPGVEMFRKDKRRRGKRKEERCASYYDEDILGGGDRRGVGKREVDMGELVGRDDEVVEEQRGEGIEMKESRDEDGRGYNRLVRKKM